MPAFMGEIFHYVYKIEITIVRRTKPTKPTPLLDRECELIMNGFWAKNSLLDCEIKIVSVK